MFCAYIMNTKKILLRDPNRMKIIESFDRKLRWIVIALISLLLIIMVACHIKTPSQEINDLFGLMGAFLSISSCIFTIVLLHNSKRQQIISEVTYNMANHSANSKVHYFLSFRQQLEWISDNLNPSNFAQKPVTIKLAVSTPLYGIGVQEKEESPGVNSLELFLDFLKVWVSEFERGEKRANKSSLTLTFWRIQDHADVFGGVKLNNNIQKQITEFEKVFSQLYSLKKRNKINLTIYQGCRSDTRIFLAENSEHASAMTVIFSPLTKSAISEKKWTLSGFSASGKRGIEQPNEFSHLLSFEDFSKNPKDMTHLFANPNEFIKAYFPQLSKKA